EEHDGAAVSFRLFARVRDAFAKNRSSHWNVWTFGRFREGLAKTPGFSAGALRSASRESRLSRASRGIRQKPDGPAFQVDGREAGCFFFGSHACANMGLCAQMLVPSASEASHGRGTLGRPASSARVPGC